MGIEERLREHGFKFEIFETAEEGEFKGFKVEELKDADFSKFEDNQLRAAWLLSQKFQKQEKYFSALDWQTILQKIEAEMQKRNLKVGRSAEETAEQPVV